MVQGPWATTATSARVVIAAQTGISGSVTIERRGDWQAGWLRRSHTRVERAVIGSKAGVLPGKIVRPSVVVGVFRFNRSMIQTAERARRRLPQLREKRSRN